MSALTDDRTAARRVAERALNARARSIAALFGSEPDRVRRLCVDAAGLHIDCAKQQISQADFGALLELARACGVEARRDAQLRGERVNHTEHRRVLHTALRRDPAQALCVDGIDIMGDVALALERMSDFAAAVRAGAWTGESGARITDVVNIGIGGSQLGPLLACEALRAASDAGPRVHFLSNIDPGAWDALRKSLSPATTLVIVASKSWKTAETARNAQAVRRWMTAGGISTAGLSRHLVGVTANPDGARSFGLAQACIFPFWDWVGGRFSLWSAIGLPVMLAAGPEAFHRMLAGARAMDEHFAATPLERNAPVLLALVTAWNRLVYTGATEAVIPYCDALRRLPAYLQQLQMESNGKSVDLNGEPVTSDTMPVVWGEAGTDAQHSFFQALHQGTSVHPVEFVVPVPAHDDPEGRGNALLANALAQAEGLLRGRSFDDGHAELRSQGVSEPEATRLARHRAHPGNRPSTTILMPRLDPASFGALIALYEHKTATLGWLWRINSFDQWGVELGKVLATRAEAMIDGRLPLPADLDASTADLIARIRAIIAARG